MTARWAAVCAIAVWAAVARAQPPDPTRAFTPPVAHSAEVPYPAGAPAHTDAIVVTAKLTVDATGQVTHVEIVGEPHPVFDDAVLAAARAFQFDPATYDGKPVAVEVTFTHTFVPPPSVAPAAEAARTDAVLRGKIVELGTRGPVTTATVTATAGERTYSADADANGRFVLPLPSGDAQIHVTAPGHDVFLQREHLVGGQELAVTYLVERDRYDPYEIVVIDEQRREEVSRITLRGAEIKQVPGTFGDPFRVVQALPGVSTVASLLPFPVVRGNSPASTAELLDGIPIPMLYHLGAGPSVLHPELIDELAFYPGGAPAPYGGYTGGVIDGRTRRARPGERLVDVDVNLLQAGALVREPLPLGVTATVAGRYGYPGLVLSRLSSDTSLSYWDYQLRLDGGNANHGWTIFAFGARDELDNRDPPPDTGTSFPPEQPARGELKPALILSFHRLDLRAQHAFGALRASARAVVGYDRTVAHDSGSDTTKFKSWLARPSARLDWQPSTALRATLGVEAAFHSTESELPMTDTPPDPFAGAVLMGIGHSSVASAFLDTAWRPGDDWLVRGGVRGDIYSDRFASRGAIDPRLTVRYRLARRDLADVPPDSDDSSVWLKGSAGVYHQPPRYLIPVPGLDQLPLSFGLLRSFQTSLGVEAPLRDRFELTAEAYYNRLDPTFFELGLPRRDDIVAPYPVLLPSEQFPNPSLNIPSDAPYLDQFTVRRLGRAYGFETMLRRRASTGLYGWLSYALSLSERRTQGRWVPYDFDRTHLFNLVAGIPLGRNWDLGLRLQYETGKPEPVLGDQVARNDGYTRFDVRFDKHAVWRSWILDFYVDITNAAVMPEEFRAGQVLHYVLPTLGARGRF